MKKHILSAIALITVVSSQIWAQDVKVYLVGSQRVTSVAVDPTGRYLATGYDNKAIILDVKTGEKLNQFEHEGPVTSVAFDSTGRYLATGYDNKALVFDIKTGRQEHKFYHLAPVNSVVFDPKGKYLAVGSDDGKVHISSLVPPF